MRKTLSELENPAVLDERRTRNVKRTTTANHHSSSDRALEYIECLMNPIAGYLTVDWCGRLGERDFDRNERNQDHGL